MKANGRPAGFWLIGEKAKGLSSPSHVYVFVNFNDAASGHEFYVVPSRVVRRHVLTELAKTGSVWHSFSKNDAQQYKDAWKVFGRIATKAT